MQFNRMSVFAQFVFPLINSIIDSKDEIKTKTMEMDDGTIIYFKDGGRMDE